MVKGSGIHCIGTLGYPSPEAAKYQQSLVYDDDPSYLRLYQPQKGTGDCSHCGGPLEKAKNALCHYCKRPI